MAVATPAAATGVQRGATGVAHALSLLMQRVALAPEERLPLTLLAVSYAALGFLVAICLAMADGAVAEAEEWRLYTIGGPAAVLAGGLGALATRAALNPRRTRSPKAPYAHLLAGQACCWLACLWALRLLVPDNGWLPPSVAYAAAAGLPVASLACAVLLGRLPWPSEQRLWGTLPFMAGLAAAPFFGGGKALGAVAIAGLGAAFVVLALVGASLAGRLGPRAVDHPAARALAGTVPWLLPLFIVVTVVDPTLHFDPHHHNFFLGPVNDVLAGKALLVESFSQYGVGVMYALAGFFSLGLAPAGYPGLSLVLSLLYVAQILLLYWQLRVTLRSVGLARLGLLTVVVITYIGQTGYPQHWPSTGPLRFGLFYALLALVALRMRHPGRARYVVAEASLLGVASLWSIETFTYLLATYLAMAVYAGLEAADGPRRCIVMVGRRLLPALAAATLVQGMFAGWVLLQTGQLPQWLTYFEYVNLYVGTGFGTLPAPAWAPWPVLGAIYAFSALALAARLVTTGRDDRTAMWRRQAMVGMTLFGLAQLSYFVGRSHPNNLYHVAIPALFLAFVWLDRVNQGAPDLPAAFRHNLLVVAAGALSLVMALHAPVYLQKLDATLAGALLSPERLQPLLAVGHPPQPSAEAAGALDLLARHAPGAPRSIVLIHPERAVEAYVAARRANVFPVANTQQEVLLPPAAWARPLAYTAPPRPGDVIILADDPARLNDLQWAMLQRLCDDYEFAILERHPAGVLAVALQELPVGQHTCSWPTAVPEPA